MKKVKPQGKLKKYASETNRLYVQVVGFGKRRKYIDTISNIFVRCFGTWWLFPDEIEY